jgi:molecular chaperone GrpE
MTDETAETQNQTAPATDDQRFEVKWRKKEQASSPAREPAPVADVTGAEDLQRQLDAERERVKDLQDRWHRAQADLANLRRRKEQEREEVERFASMLLVAELLPVLDNFERALATVPGNLAMLTWIQGVALVERHLRAILEHQGLAPIEAQGQPFSPHYHEAISERETSEFPPGTVVLELQKGYTMHGRVIRPALVELAKAPPSGQPEDRAAPEPAPESTDEETAEHIADDAELENLGP